MVDSPGFRISSINSNLQLFLLGNLGPISLPLVPSNLSICVCFVLTGELLRNSVFSIWDASKNSGTPKSSILIGFSIIFTIHFGVPLLLETAI